MKYRKLLSTLFYFLFVFNANSQLAPDTTQNISFGLRYTYNYNYKIDHHTPSMCLNIKKHTIYLGVDYTCFLINPPYGDSEVKFTNNVWGINLGYRYYLKTKCEKLSVFAQLNFSIYQVKYKEHQLGQSFEKEQKT